MWSKLFPRKHNYQIAGLAELRGRLNNIASLIQEVAPDSRQSQQQDRKEHQKSDAMKEVLAVVSKLEARLRKLAKQNRELDTDIFSDENSTLAIDDHNAKGAYGADNERIELESSSKTEIAMKKMRSDSDAERNQFIAGSSEKKQGFEIEINKMRDEVGQVKAELEDHTKKLEQAREALTAETERHKAQKRKLEQQFDAEKLQTKSLCDEKLAEMESYFEANTLRLTKEFAVLEGRLRGDIESLNGALLTRDRFTPITDHEFESRFSGLAEEINQCARLPCVSKQSDWTDHFLNQISKNPKRLKKELLQDSLWMILYENIFCSPFRVFGEEGRKLETQWNDAFGKGLYHLSPCWAIF